MIFLPFGANRLGQSVYQVNLRSDREHRPLRRGFNQRNQLFSRFSRIGFLAYFIATFRMHNHPNAGVLRAHLVHMAR